MTQSAQEWGNEIWAMSIVQRTSEEFGQIAHQILTQGQQEGSSDRTKLLEACEFFLKALASRKRGGLPFDPTYADWDTVKHVVDKAITDTRKDGASC